MWLHLESVLQSGTGAQLVLPLRHQNTAICAPQHVTAAAWRPSRCVKRQHRRHILQPLLALQVEAPTSPLAVEDAWQLLEEFSAKEMRGLAQQFLDSAEKRRLLRDALLVAAGAPHVPAGWSPDAAEAPAVLLGVMASDVRLAVRALRDYCQALGLPFKMPESRVPEVAAAPAITGPVYVKFNSVSGLCYASRYEGRDRGVLVQLGQQQLGHFPLGLHDEQMLQPPPPAG